MIKPLNALTQNASAADGTAKRTTRTAETPHHSQHSQQRSEHYHKNIVPKSSRPSGVDGVERIQALNPTKTLPQASAINTETMGPG